MSQFLGRQLGLCNISVSHNLDRSLWAGMALSKRYLYISLFNHQTCVEELACARNIEQEDQVLFS